MVEKAMDAFERGSIVVAGIVAAPLTAKDAPEAVCWGDPARAFQRQGDRDHAGGAGLR
jgi:hypothetical protein